ncbi:MAG TPA: AI-2E family transporter, partial [Bacteroidetes bacterium]|nr:AI-2E family transporter [Bacteroidota bacterium]
GVLSIIALYLLDIPYYILIGSIAGLANLIPYFGPIVGAVPAIIASLMHNPSLTPILWIAVAFAVVQLIDNVLISPLVVAKSVNIHPLVVIVVIFIGEQLLGLMGMLLAVPITAILKVMIQETIWSFKHYRLL